MQHRVEESEQETEKLKKSLDELNLRNLMLEEACAGTNPPPPLLIIKSSEFIYFEIIIHLIKILISF